MPTDPLPANIIVGDDKTIKCVDPGSLGNDTPPRAQLAYPLAKLISDFPNYFLAISNDTITITEDDHVTIPEQKASAPKIEWKNLLALDPHIKLKIEFYGWRQFGADIYHRITQFDAEKDLEIKTKIASRIKVEFLLFKQGMSK